MSNNIIELAKKTPVTITVVDEIAKDLKQKINDREVSPLLIQQHFKAVETIKEKIKDVLSKASFEEASKYPEKSFHMFGAEFTKGEFGVKYHYEECNDPVWMRLNAEFLAKKKELEDRQNFLKTIKGHETVVDEASGEIVTVYPPSKTSTSGVACTIK